MTPRRVIGIGLMLLAGFALWSGLGGVVDLAALVRSRDDLVALVAAHPAASAALYAAAYLLVVVFALPVALVMTLLGGWLFGPVWGSILAAGAATVGAMVLFILARGLLHDYFLRRTGPLMARLRAEFHAEAASYLLLMRFAPVFPFFVVNLAAALMGARLSTYSWTTLVGILPATVAFALAGAGLGAVLEQEAARLAACAAAGSAPCTARLDTAALVSPQLMLALVALAGVSALSIVGRRILAKGRASAGTEGRS